MFTITIKSRFYIKVLENILEQVSIETNQGRNK